MSIVRTAAEAETTSTGVDRPIDLINPVTKLTVALIISVALVLTIDWVSGSVAVAAELALLPFSGLSVRSITLRCAPIAIAAVLSTITITLYGRTSGVTYFHWAFIHVSDGSIVLAIATLLRVLAIGIPAVILFASVDPTDLADALGQILHLPARFVIGALAGLRLIGLFIDDWKALGLSRRARGLSDRGLIRKFASMAGALFVLSVRRGDKMATAMEARGFGGRGKRTWARESRLTRADAIFLAIGIGITALAVGLSVATGHWNFIGAL